jgi:hypothetical protein
MAFSLNSEIVEKTVSPFYLLRSLLALVWIVSVELLLTNAHDLFAHFIPLLRNLNVHGTRRSSFALPLVLIL